MSEIIPFLQRLRSFSVSGAVRYLLLRIRGKSILVTGSCRQCGMCCRCISLEGRQGWLHSKKAFYDIVKDHPEYERFAIIGSDADGFLLFSCRHHSSDGTCLDYEKRLPLCRRFPESSLLFAGGRLPPTCGYGFAEVVSFQKFLDKAMHRQK